MFPLLLRWLSRRSLGFVHLLGTWVGWVGYLASATYRHRFDHLAESRGR